MDYSVLVLSCDKYANILQLFFKYYKRFFNADAPLYLSLESADYHYEGLDIKVLHSAADNWSTRVKEALSEIPTKAVLLLLDDFLIESEVDTDELSKLARLINDDNGIAHFALTTVPMQNDSDTVFFERYYKRYRYGRYKTTLQAGMWNREELISILKDGETPWEVEAFGNIRSFVSPRDYFAVTDKSLKPIDYNDGFFCVQGKLNEAEMTRLSEKLGDDFSVEGMQTDGGNLVRDKRSFSRRVATRLRIMAYYTVYRMRSVKGKKRDEA